MTNSEVSVSYSRLHYCVLCEDNGHKWRPREGASNCVDRRSKLGLVEGANAASTRSRKLWKLFIGEEKLAVSAEQGEKDAFGEKCINATMRLTYAMSPAVVLLVQSLDCPVKIWERLERQYEKRTAASKLSLVQRYFGAKMAEGESAEKHLLNMSKLCDRLAAVELPVPEEFQPLMILASLPASYTAIVQTLGSQSGKLDLSQKARKWQPR